VGSSAFVTALQIGVVGEDLLNRHLRSEQLQQHLHGIPQSTDHRLAVADRRFGGDPVESRHAASALPDGIDGCASAGDLRLSAAQCASFATLQASARWLAYQAVASISARRASTRRRTMASGSWWSAE
jgi:hypothetical protein